MTDQNRYDRQLRLWGEVAQNRLEHSHLLTIGSDCVSTEFLKSIILPGIGHVTIADNKIIDEFDIETNFFVEISDVEKQRGEITLKNLLELNDRVTGEFKCIDLQTILKTENETHFLKQFNIIVCTNQKHSEVLQLTEMTEYPVIEVCINGYLGYVKAYYKSFVIFDNGSEKVMDLRIQEPFPKLIELYNSIDWKNISKEDHSHLPFPLILLRAMNEWKNEMKEKNESNEMIGEKYEMNLTNVIPKKIGDKNRIKQIIKTEQKSYIEENFTEALKYAFHCWAPAKGEITQLMNDQRKDQFAQMNINEDKEFWMFINVVRKFYDKNGRIPVNPTLNDMICGNEFFVKLQTAYRNQMDEDVKEMMEEVVKLNELCGSEILNEESVRRYCKSIRRMRVHDGITPNRVNVDSHGNEIKEIYNDYDFEGDESLMMYLMIFYGVFEFVEQYGRMPCDTKDVEELKKQTEKIMKMKGLENIQVNQQQVEEICRFGGVQIHAVNSVIGSFVGQEVVKFTTHQFECLHSTFLFNLHSGQSLHGLY